MNVRSFRSFIKNRKERKDRSNVLLKRTDAQPCEKWSRVVKKIARMVKRHESGQEIRPLLKNVPSWAYWENNCFLNKERLHTNDFFWTLHIYLLVIWPKWWCHRITFLRWKIKIENSCVNSNPPIVFTFLPAPSTDKNDAQMPQKLYYFSQTFFYTYSYIHICICRNYGVKRWKNLKARWVLIFPGPHGF